mmetsp:Transcript_41259/g.62819  ORF Transcript_41259/g.62819 Transcript_41259/m.62819 type:complete len:436 (+) Transcript_41259:878-2185(+)
MSDDLVRQVAEEKKKKSSTTVDSADFKPNREEEIEALFEFRQEPTANSTMDEGKDSLGDDPYDPIINSDKQGEDLFFDFDDTQADFVENHPIRQSLYEPPRNMNSFYVRHQSVIDPDSQNILLHYDLDKFKNSLWENFLGSSVEISYLVDADGKRTVVNQNVNKMGPIQLRVSDGNLLNAWEKTLVSEIEDYKGEEEGQRKVIETWVCRPPNVLLFQVNRVNYDFKTGNPEKDNRQFDFDKTIFLDMFLNANKDKSKEFIERLEQLQPKIAEMKQAVASNDFSQLESHFSACESAIEKAQADQRYVSLGAVEKFLNDDDLIGLNDFSDSLDLSPAELSGALAVLKKFKAAASSKKKRVEEKIRQYEQEVASKYTSLKDRPYFLHAIIIHDGLAQNGHYFSYVFDRVRMTWWEISDHLAKPVPEKQVMEDALGKSS